MSEEQVTTQPLGTMSRRTFLKWSAVLGGAAALAANSGPGIGLRKAEAAPPTASQGQWVSVACWHNCGGRCLNKAFVVDGVVTKQKTDDTHPDSPDFPQQRGCARGRSQRMQVFGADRIKYPMKRKNWAPGGGNKELRGKDEWVRISWDEALSIVASELKRIKDNYGNASIFLPRTTSRLMNAYGGGMDTWGVTSEGAWPQVRDKMTAGLWGTNDRLDYRYSKLVVMWNSDPIWSSGGNPAYNYLQAKKAGAKFIFVDPFYNSTAQALADEWIPVRPGTDTALMLGIAHYMITNKLQDQAFLDKYTVGFDADHMPKGADPKENFKDYVLGTYDNTPKTPEWAAEICGTPVATIKSLAYQMATTKPMIMQASASASRTYFGQQYCQAFFTVGWMTGNVGVPGAAIGFSYHNYSGYGGLGTAWVRPGGSGLPAIPNPLAGGVAVGYTFADPENTKFQAVAYEEMWDAILNNKYHATARGVIPCDLRMIYRVQDGNGGNAFNQASGIPKAIQAYRKLEFVVSSDIVLSSATKFADVVLPTTTPWEQDFGGLLSGNPEMMIWYSQVTNPLYEAKDCQWIEMELAKRLGLDPNALYPIPRAQQVFNQLATSTVIKADGSGYEPLLTINDQDLAGLRESGITGKAQTGRVSLSDFMTKGIYQLDRKPGDKIGTIQGQAFRADPVANALKTATGKLEIHCQPLSTKIAAYGLTTTPPIAQYRKPVEGFEDTFADWDQRIKGPFPLQLVTKHYPRRSHSVFDNIIQLRRAFAQDLLINSIDADARGIKQGDMVLVSSRWGKVLRPAVITNRVIPGVILLGEGAWTELDDPKGIDKAGATNTLNGPHLCGQGEEPWNTCNVQVEKWTGERLTPDYTWPQRIPIKGA